MKLLSLDTSTQIASVALTIDGITQSEEQHHVKQHAQFLLPIIERLLAAAESNLASLDGIVFNAGPGSFTGLRIACSVAKALAYVHDLPLFPVSSLQIIAFAALAAEPRKEDVQVLALLDARMQQLYWAQIGNENLTTASLSVSSAEDIILSGAMPCIVAGVGFQPFLARLSADVQSRIIKQCEIFPHAITALNLVMTGKILSVSAIDAIPYYVRNHVTQGGVHE